MKFVDNIKEQQYEQFVKDNNAYFTKSYYWGEVQKQKGFKPHYVGLISEDKLIATALLLEKKVIGKYSFVYVPRGYIIDYNDYKLLELFTQHIKEYCKKLNAIFFRIDPDIRRHNIDIDGNIIGSENNYSVIKSLKKLHYLHKGYNKNFENSQPRFTFNINIENGIEEALKNMHATTRKILNKKNQYNLDIYKGNINDMNDFYITMIETSKREGIIQSKIEYYKKFYEVLNKRNMSDLYVVKTNIKKLIELYEQNILNTQNEISSLDSEKYKNDSKKENIKNDLVNKLNKLNKELEIIKNISDKEVVLSSIITVKYNDTVYTVHGGNNSILMELNANYLLYYQIMSDACDNNYKYVDCFGTTGIANPSKSDPIYGIHLFKKRLGGELVEYIGEFDYVLNKPLYYLYIKVWPKLRKIVKHKQ